MEIKQMTLKAWGDVSRIYSEGIQTGNATFETSCPDWPSWDKNHRSDCRLVAIDNKKVVGWAALSEASERCIYNGVCEVSIYVDKNFAGKGIGHKLMKKLIEEAESSNIWTLQAGIFPENLISIRLHTKNEFRIVGSREKIGRMKNMWRDVVLMERRSKKIGIS